MTIRLTHLVRNLVPVTGKHFTVNIRKIAAFHTNQCYDEVCSVVSLDVLEAHTRWRYNGGLVFVSGHVEGPVQGVKSVQDTIEAIDTHTNLPI